MPRRRFALQDIVETVARAATSAHVPVSILPAPILPDGPLAETRPDEHCADARHAAGIECPICTLAMIVTAERALAEFAPLDISLRRMDCPRCGMLASRLYHPTIGYDHGNVC